MLLVQMTPPHHTPPACAQAKFKVHVETEDPNTNSATISLTMLTGPGVIGINVDQIDLSRLDQCLDAKFIIDSSQTPVFQPVAIIGDKEFHQFVPLGEMPDSKQFSTHYWNTPHNAMQNGLHHYYMYISDDVSGQLPTKYTIDPTVRNRPPVNQLILILSLLIVLGGAEFLVAFIASRLHRWWS